MAFRSFCRAFRFAPRARSRLAALPIAAGVSFAFAAKFAVCQGKNEPNATTDQAKEKIKDMKDKVKAKVKESAQAVEAESKAAKDMAKGAKGSGAKVKQMALDLGADVAQSFRPLKSVHAHLCGLHWYVSDPSRSVEAEHYCSHNHSDELFQCILYDSNRSDAKLIGIEYVISERLFNSLPNDEKKLWHSHRYEVKSGLLTAPGLPKVAENELMQTLVNTYGKTFHLWQVDRGDTLPIGLPQLMMSFTDDGQLLKEEIDARDQRHGLVVSTEKRRKRRRGLEAHPVARGADDWDRDRPHELTFVPVDEAQEKGTSEKIKIKK